MNADLVLYVYEHCPFCKKVENFINEHSLNVSVVDVDATEGAREKLLTEGGKTQCPCLFIDGTPLYESSDIIAYLEKHLVKA